MKKNGENFRTENWINEQIPFGKYTFSREQLSQGFPDNSPDSLKLSLNRLSKKGKILSVHKDFYVIVSPEYSSRGILPPALFIDGLMKFLNRPYYVGLLNAAAFYGAAHQSPQETFVFTTFPSMRSTKKKGILINYISKTTVASKYLEDKKTETGMLKVSSPELTAIDVVQYQKRIGGLNRTASILEELAEAIRLDKITAEFLAENQVSVVQRLGFLFENVIGENEIAEKIYESAKEAQLNFFPVALNSAKKTSGFSGGNRWKVVENTKIELD